MQYPSRRLQERFRPQLGAVALLAGLVFAVSGCGLLSDDSGPDYVQADATGGTFSAERTATADVDYQIAVNAGSFYVLTVESNTGNIDVFVYGDEEQTNLLESSTSSGTGTETVSLNTFANDTLYVNLRVWFREGETSHDYSINVTEDTP